MTVAMAGPKSIEERKAMLAQQVANAVSARRARIESQSDYQAVVVVGRRVNHILHFLIGLFTFGLWWVVWVLLAAAGGEKRELLQVDPYGNVVHRRV